MEQFLKISQSEYRQLDGISRSELFEMAKSPLHYRYNKLNKIESEPTPALIFGSLTHKLVLEPDSFNDEFVVMPDGIDRRTKEGKETYNRLIEEANGKMIVSESDYMKALEMAAAVKKHPTASKLLYSGKPQYEVSLMWTDDETGIRCKIRPDAVNEIDGTFYCLDYKTTDSCQDGHFERSVKKYGYRLQSGMYHEGLFENTFEDFKFVFIAQEKTAPYAVRIYECDSSFIEAGTEDYKAFLQELLRCAHNNEWNGYEDEILSEND